ncbi:hypothetical protein EMCRGX_G026832 [Ephydatia muelleri]
MAARMSVKKPNRLEFAVRDCSIHSVVVYKDRAEVKRIIRAELLEGTNEVVISGLAETINRNSIRVEGQGLATITDVVYSSSVEQGSCSSLSDDKQREYQTLLREKEKREIQTLCLTEEVLREERALLSKYACRIFKNGSAKGAVEELDALEQSNVAKVMEFADQYESKLAQLDKRIQDTTTLTTQRSVKLGPLETNNATACPMKRGLVRVFLETAMDTEVTMFLSYVVSNASWTSAYDVRVFSKVSEKSLKLQYFALLKQSTGEDWINTRISLSTAQPSIGGAAPDLPTHTITFKRHPPPSIIYYGGQERFRGSIGSGKSGGTPSPQFPPGGAGAGQTPPLPPPVDVDVSEVSAGLYNATFTIPRAATIPADSTEHKVTVALIDLFPELSYTCVPRLSPYSFLRAKVKNTSPYTLLSGPANIFLDNNFIAKSKLCDASPNEDFTLSLGADQSIRVTCNPIAITHGNTRGLIKNNLDTFVHILEVRNTKENPVQLELQEQVPLSTSEKIKVTIVEPDLKRDTMLPFGTARLNDMNNMEYHLTVPPDRNIQLRLEYTVEYPQTPGVFVDGLPRT